jgi:hypothetical protein
MGRVDYNRRDPLDPRESTMSRDYNRRMLHRAAFTWRTLEGIRLRANAHVDA